MEPLNEHEELKRIAPTLYGMEKHDPFVVPDGVFDRLPHEVQAAIVARAYRSGCLALPVLVRRLGIALPVVALLTGAWWILHNKPGTAVAELSTTPSLDELSWSEEHELLASLDEQVPGMEVADIDLTDDELAAYLAYENIDLTDQLTEQ